MFDLRSPWSLLSIGLILAVACPVGKVFSESQPPPSPSSDGQNPPLFAKGKAVYEQLCISCHGRAGEGVKGGYETPLVGDASVGELAKLIEETMPKDEAERCVGEDAKAVATYIHHQFYSEAAQVRHRPPRLGLARLTANQLRQSLSDLYAQMDGVAAIHPQSGVSGQYFEGSRWKADKKKLERIDSTIDFDFGKSSPVEGIDPTEFYILWEGNLLAETTGRYEIIVQSTCSFVMDFGRMGRQLIDNHVQSGDRIEFRRTLELTAGRAYPFKIEFVQRKRKTEQPPARIALRWVKPLGVEEVIPARALIPLVGPAAFSIQSPLPADDRSYGYERGISVHRQWDESVTAAALEFAQHAADELWPRYREKHKKESDENRRQLKAFLGDILFAAFRGSLPQARREWYLDQQIADVADDLEAIRRVCLIALKSPYFLYPELCQEVSPSQRVANRLALTLHDSLPIDRWLLREIEGDRLTNQEAIRQAARRMLDDYRAKAKIRELFHEWLAISQSADIAKDPGLFPGFDGPLIADLRDSLDLFVDDVVWSKSSSFQELFLADWTYTNRRLAEFYGADWQGEDGAEPSLALVKSRAAPGQRFGVVTHPYLMSRLAYHHSTSPIHRGVFLIRYLLGRTLRPPNEAFAPLSPDLHPDLTTRERVELQTHPENCQGCHIKINGLGFTLENFDTVGRYRARERDRLIDPRGSYTTRADETIDFHGAGELAKFLASSHDARRAFVTRAFHHLVKQPAAAYGPSTTEHLLERFEASNLNIRELFVEIAAVATEDGQTVQRNTTDEGAPSHATP